LRELPAEPLEAVELRRDGAQQARFDSAYFDL
jgi:hypothetical protein